MDISGPSEREQRDALGDEIAALMGPLIRELRTALRTCAESSGLSQSEANTLWVLSGAGPLTTGDLARRLDIDPANASTMLTRLEKRGLVERLPSPTDRRKRLATLTGEGQEMRTRLANCVGKRRPTFRDLSLDDLTTFRDLLRRVTSTRPTALD